VEVTSRTNLSENLPQQEVKKVKKSSNNWFHISRMKKQKVKIEF